MLEPRACTKSYDPARCAAVRYPLACSVARRCTQLATLAAAAAAAVVLGAPGAEAQAICGQRAAIVDQLETKYGETRRSIGFQQGRGVVETWANDDTGTWSIVVTNPQGITCLLAAGEAFESEAIRVAEERPI